MLRPVAPTDGRRVNFSVANRAATVEAVERKQGLNLSARARLQGHSLTANIRLPCCSTGALRASYHTVTEGFNRWKNRLCVSNNFVCPVLGEHHSTTVNSLTLATSRSQSVGCHISIHRLISR